MLRCDMCKERSREVVLHAYAFGRWVPLCPECWRKARHFEAVDRVLGGEEP